MIPIFSLITAFCSLGFIIGVIFGAKTMENGLKNPTEAPEIRENRLNA